MPLRHGCSDLTGDIQADPWSDGTNGCAVYEQNTGWCAMYGANNYHGEGAANAKCCACGGGDVIGTSSFHCDTHNPDGASCQYCTPSDILLGQISMLKVHPSQLLERTKETQNCRLCRGDRVMSILLCDRFSLLLQVRTTGCLRVVQIANPIMRESKQKQTAGQHWMS